MTKANDYDKWAARRQVAIKSGQDLPHAYVEKPAMDRLLPDVGGKKVLLLGCGTGEESLLLREHGASDLVGVDNSAGSIKLARETYPECEFRVGDMHSLEFDDETFDLVYSSLTIHYSASPGEVYAEICRVLKPGGYLQFSVGHPLRWASERIELDSVTTKILGYSEDPDSRILHGTYSSLSQHSETFPNGEVLQFYIGPPSLHFRLLKEAGFLVEEFIESQPIADCKAVDEWYYLRNSEFPQFSIFLAKKA